MEPRKRKRASLADSGQKKQQLVESAHDDLQQLQGAQGLVMENYLRLHCQGALLAYLEECPLLRCCDSVQRLESGDFVEPFLALVISATHPVQGCCFALATYMDALRALVMDALATVAIREDARKKGVLVLRVEYEERGVMEQLARSQLLQSGEVSISTDRNLLALYNDRELDYLAQYGHCNKQRVALFTLTLYDRLVAAMVVPAREHQYSLQLRENQYVRSYATLEAECRALRLECAKQPVNNTNEQEMEKARDALLKHDAYVKTLEEQALQLKALARKAVEDARAMLEAKPNKKAKKGQ